jgi:hypothetical protein
VVDYLLIPTSVQYQDYNFVTWTSLISLKLEQISALHKIKAYDKRRENQERRIWCVRRFEVDIKKMGFSIVNIFVDSQKDTKRVFKEHYLARNFGMIEE